MAGKNSVIAKLAIKKIDPNFKPFLIIIHNKTTKIPEIISLGCMNVSRPNIKELITKYLMNPLSFFSTKSFIINPIAIKNPEAVKLSYPIASELKDKVGLSMIKIKTKYENLFNLVRYS